MVMMVENRTGDDGGKPNGDLATKFSEVESFIEEWKLTHNDLIWETVLWACKLHGNVEFGERVTEKLIELELEVDSNIFAVREKWDDVAKVRTLMSEQGIKKTPEIDY
ncbi:hypothetical protein LWI29_037427 [Acer saccharum]|uniref:Uncharacterized protein n=1 Tax=Acer saccharum TaxID=4024 RepID=A0AA39TAG3_ACESA|nr:hypothetical protein LWI29_037427 [Acer saccharum]